MKKAYYTLLAGFIIESIGFVWDLIHHLSSGVAEGLDEFFTVPAHDVALAGFLITLLGFFELTVYIVRKKRFN